jgi:two-component system OmpR family response regulator
VKILLVEDDNDTSEYVAQGLREEAHHVHVSADGRDGLSRAVSEKWDMIIVDRMLPKLDGMALVRTLRGRGLEVPILFLTTLGGIDDRVSGLDAGGDDYLIKPFAFSELVARVNALGRRPRHTAPVVRRKVGDLEIELISRCVIRAGQHIELQPREFQLLEYLVQHAGKVVTRTMLLEAVWNFHFDPRTNIVESHISRLRAKVDKGHPVELIETVRGTGYRIRASA